MPANPVLVYEGPDSTSIKIGLILHDGSRLAARGTFARKPNTSGTASDALALTGITAWVSLAFLYDEKQIAHLVPDVNGDGLARSQMYRVVAAQRTSGTARWDTVECALADDPQAVPTGRDFDPADFDPADFA